MVNLVSNELFKIYHKNSVYVLGIVLFLFVILNTYICKISGITNSKDVLISEFSFINLFIVISIVMISSGIVSEEYSSGSIKTLLIKPYKRYQILLSKLISVIISFVVFVILYFVMCFICYGLLDRFGSYDINMFKEIGKYMLFLLPEYMIILLFSFFVSCLVDNPSSCNVLGIGLFIGSSIINDIVINNNLKYLRWIPTMCWDLSNRGDSSMLFCIVVCIVTILVLICGSFIIFNNKEIKNR